jgi:hypothetical protein
MKKFFNYLALALVLALGTTACSNFDADTPEDKQPATGTQNVKLKVIIPGASTYAAAGDEASYKNAIPTLHDAKIYFTDGITILRAHPFSNSDIEDLENPSKGQVVQDVPITATTYYFIGNEGVDVNYGLKNEAGDAVVITEGSTTLDDFKKQMFDITQQKDAQTNLHLFATGTFTPAGSGTTDLQIQLRPAVARIEIGEIENTGSKTFTLEAIAINNSFTKISVDPAIYPEAASSPDSINYAYNAGIWDNLAASVSSYKGGLALAVNKSGSNIYTPDNGVWGFNVVPAQYKDGAVYKGNNILTEINNVAKRYIFGAVPMIVFKLTSLQDASPVASNGNYYLTVTRYKEDDANGRTIEYFKAGYIYKITKIEFTNDDVTPDHPIPGLNAQTDVTVTVQVQPWVEQPVHPEF